MSVAANELFDTRRKMRGEYARRLAEMESWGRANAHQVKPDEWLRDHEDE